MNIIASDLITIATIAAAYSYSYIYTFRIAKDLLFVNNKKNVQPIGLSLMGWSNYWKNRSSLFGQE